MRKRFSCPIGQLVPAISVLAFLLYGCSTLPPVQPAKDLKNFVGKWQGKIWNVDWNWDFNISLTAEEDGIFFMSLPSFLGVGLANIVGKWGVKEGKIWFKSEEFWMNGTGILHEGGGKRAVIFHSDDGRTTGWVIPFSNVSKVPELK